MKKLICMLFLIQGGMMMAQTETFVTINGKKVAINPNTVNTADNGLTATGSNVQLGGALTKPSVLTTTSASTLALKGLQTGAAKDSVVVRDANGVLKSVASASLGDNLGNHIATKNLDMAANDIRNAQLIRGNSIASKNFYIEDVTNTNDDFGLIKENGIFKIRNRSIGRYLQDELKIDQVTGKTTVTSAQIAKGTDGSVPAVGSVAVSADGNGNVKWVAPSALGAGDNLGNHTAILDLAMNGKNIVNALNTTATGTATAASVVATTKATVQTMQITKGSDSSIPVLGSVAVAADGNGNVKWVAPSTITSNNWNVAGNTGTNAATNFIGTTDAQSLVLKTNNAKRLEIDANGALTVGAPATSTGLYFDPAKGSLMAGTTVGTVSGTNTTTLGGPNNVAEGTSTAVLGGTNNKVSGKSAVIIGGNTNTASGENAAILGGLSNTVTGKNSVVISGYQNKATGDHSTVGGYLSQANGLISTALGGLAVANHDYSMILTDGMYSKALTSSKRGDFTTAFYGGYRFILDRAKDPNFNGAALNETGFYSLLDNDLSLGTSTNKWKEIYGGSLFTQTAQIAKGSDGSVPAAGSVATAADDKGNVKWVAPSAITANSWNVTGNAGTTAATNFIGTTDAQSLVLKTNNAKRLELDESGNVTIGNSPFDMSVYNGGMYYDAAKTSFVFGARMQKPPVGSRMSMTFGQSNINAGSLSVILGGISNEIGTATTNTIILGGMRNYASNVGSAVLAGNRNIASGYFSYAMGTFSKAINDGSYVLTDGTGTDANGDPLIAISSTADNQFTGSFANGYRFLTDRTTSNGVVLNSSGFMPITNNTMTLGGSTAKWKEIYAVNGLIQTSDIRLKTNIKPLQYGLKDILAIDPISYSFKTDVTNKIQLGVSAQQLQTILPEAVVEGSDAQKTLGVNYSEMIPVLINAIKEQQKQIDNQQKQIVDLKDQISNLTQK